MNPFAVMLRAPFVMLGATWQIVLMLIQVVGLWAYECCAMLITAGFDFD